MDDDAIRIPLRARDGSVRAWAIVDREDADLAESRWYCQFARGGRPLYARHAGGKPFLCDSSFSTVSMHRVILWRKLGGEIGPSDFTDHINGDGLDNRRGNLRAATDAQNKANRTARRLFTSRYMGVHKRKRRAQFRAQISVGGKTRVIGDFYCEEEAARAYDRAAREYHGEFARPNFPDGDA